MRRLNDAIVLLARALLGLIFIVAGVKKFGNLAGIAAYMAGAGMPGPIISPLLYLSALIELLAGILLAAGFQARAAALVLFLFLIPVTIIFHALTRQPIQVLKNLAIMGGLLMLVAHGPGRLSFDRAQSDAGL